MQNLLNDLTQLLKKDERFISEDKLLKNKVVEAALKPDEDLLKLLISNATTKKHFFKNIDGILVFDKIQFQKFVSNKTFLPDSYTSFTNKIGLTSNDEFISESNNVVLSWPYKDCILEGGQTKEEEKRDEIFWNEILAPDEIDRLLSPKVFTNFKKYDKNGEHKAKDFSLNDNYIIKGNNLLTLHSLLPIYRNKVKLMYFDPPYNTGGSTDSFNYNNNFKNSSWLTFIKNRIDVAKEFLREDGFVAVTIDHVELFYLGALLDEIFGINNRVGIVTIYINPKGRQHEKFFSAATEYMLVYAKNISCAKFNKVTLDLEKAKSFNLSDKNGKYRLSQFMRIRSSTQREIKPDFWYPIYVSKDLKNITLEKNSEYYKVLPKVNNVDYTWKTISSTFEERNQDDYFVAKKEDNEIVIYHKYYEQQVFKNIWIDKKYFPEFQGTNLLKNLLGENLFSYPKSLYAVIDTLKLMTKDTDIIFDIFAGSGTTGHATLELNKEDNGKRKFVLCEQLNYIENVTVERIKKVINKYNKEESFIYSELLNLNQNFVEQIKRSNSTKELKSILENIKSNGFISYKIYPKNIDDNVTDFEKLSFEDQKKFLIEVLDKNHLYVNYSEVDDKDYKISDDDKKLNRLFYGLK